MELRKKRNLYSFGCSGVRNIPDSTLCQDKLLCAIKLKEQNKKLQQFPLIGKTATKHQAKESKIKKWNFGENRFYTLAADRAAGCQPASGRQRIPHNGTVHPRQMRKSPNWETPKGNFPKPKRRENCCPNLESTKFGRG
ncbi:hypothetical protein DSO57_1011832 [Entomophthora muscae]|uniref:Uncharacterized protein n=1 Tax=Entomophthora muscae TaxID=34485 RepID=A0ACC2UST8_9FUNG|nr:hypothetical protein DSO57_1011832 [Entomophthora muscae]